MTSKPTKNSTSASRHPAKTNLPAPTPPVDGADGFTGHVFEQRKKNWEERDAPLSERKTRE